MVIDKPYVPEDETRLTAMERVKVIATFLIVVRTYNMHVYMCVFLCLFGFYCVILPKGRLFLKYKENSLACICHTVAQW